MVMEYTIEKLRSHKSEIETAGVTVLNDVFTDAEVENLQSMMQQAEDRENLLFRKTADLFAIRQFLKAVPSVKSIILTPKLHSIISSLFGDDYFIVKSIYFDKPPLSNWFVAYHQDLTISVKEKIETPGFATWTVKQGQFAVQPPLSILEDNFTIRIHLDDTNADNGALKIMSGSHLKGIYRPETVDPGTKEELFCEVPKGGIMVMKPLLLHASNRTVNEGRRRVIHIEFSRQDLPGALQWSEKEEL